MRRYDNDADGTFGEDGAHEHFFLTDHQFTVVAIIDDVAALVERITYDATSVGGEAQHHRIGDLDGDGIDTHALLPEAIRLRVGDSPMMTGSLTAL